MADECEQHGLQALLCQLELQKLGLVCLCRICDADTAVLDSVERVQPARPALLVSTGEVQAPCKVINII